MNGRLKKCLRSLVPVLGRRPKSRKRPLDEERVWQKVNRLKPGKRACQYVSLLAFGMRIRNLAPGSCELWVGEGKNCGSLPVKDGWVKCGEWEDYFGDLEAAMHLADEAWKKARVVGFSLNRLRDVWECRFVPYSGVPRSFVAKSAAEAVCKASIYALLTSRRDAVGAGVR